MLFLQRRTCLPSALIGLVAGAALTSGCAGGSPTPAPAAPATTASPNISIVSLSVTAESVGSGGYAYRVIARLRESGGAPATIAAIDLSFMRESSIVASLHSDRPISDAANVCPANATVDSRELLVRDENPAHPRAASVIAKVTFTDGAAMTGSATASADVPAPDPPPSTPAFTLTGVVSDETGGHPVARATVQIVDGANAGMRASTDGNGAYTLADVAAGGLSLHAEADGYESTDQRVTVSQNTRVDLRLRTIRTAPPPSSPCAYTISPSSLSTLWMGGSFVVAITRTSGTCSWQATPNASWITLTGSASGTGSASLGYIVLANGGVVSSNTRVGGITITWTGGSAQLSVTQGGANPELCRFTIGINGQDRVTVPSAGGQFTATVTWINTGHPSCTGLAFADGVLATFPGPISNPFFGPSGGSLTFTARPNPSPGTARSGYVEIRSSSGTATLTVLQP